MQIYACHASEPRLSWTLEAPEASLVDGDGHALAKHYAGPTWESLADGSKVMASKISAYSGDPSAIPLLLLKASSHEGAGRMSDVSYIQRLATRRGLPPSAGCDAAHVGDVIRVEYAATYYFYRPEAAP